jgi:hypothetical protein
MVGPTRDAQSISNTEAKRIPKARAEAGRRRGSQRKNGSALTALKLSNGRALLVGALDHLLTALADEL